MKIYVCHARSGDYEETLYRPVRASGIDRNHDIVLPHEAGKPVGDSKETIRGCDLVIAEVSLPSTGTGIELGWAEIFGVPIVCVSRRGAKIAGSLARITDRFETYADERELVECLERAIIRPR